MTSISTQYSEIDSISKAKTIAEWLQEKKALELLVLDNTGQQNPLTEVTIIANATSLRHGQGLADFILEQCRNNNFEFLQMEGFAVGEWILLDLNDVIIHIFQEENRAHYNLDDLWPEAETILDTRSEK